MDKLTLLLIVSPLLVGLVAFVALVIYGLRTDPDAGTRIPYPPPPLPRRHG